MGLLREEMVCVLGGWREGCSTVNYSSKEKQSCQMLLMGLHCQSLINGKTILLMGNWAAYRERERERERESGGGSRCSIVNHSSKKKTISPNVGNGTALRENGCEEGGRDRKGWLWHCPSLINGKTILLMGNWAAHREREQLQHC